jgi:uncharacterized protein (UPF0335 family)
MNKELTALAERIARLEDDKAEIASDIRDLKAEAKAQGYDPTVLAKVVRVMRMDADKRKKLFDQAELFDVYLAGVGLLPDTAPAKAGPQRTLTNPRHVVKPAEVQQIADRAQERSAHAVDPPPQHEEKDHAAAAPLAGQTGHKPTAVGRDGVALVAASFSDDEPDIPDFLDRRGGEALRC